jgi:hypothetical protein
MRRSGTKDTPRAPWQPSEIYVRARGAMDAVLFRHGYEPHTEQYVPYAFGSAFAVYCRARDVPFVGLGWDGRDSGLSLQSSDDGQTYQTVAESSLGLDKSTSEQVADEIARLAAAVESLVATGRAL